MFDLRRPRAPEPPPRPAPASGPLVTSRADFDCDRPTDPRGLVEVEAPCRLGETLFVGECRVGAFTYFNHGVEATTARLGRYCSVARHVLIGPGAHHTGFVTTHPLGSDPSGFSSAMHDSPAYRAAVANACAQPGIDVSQLTLIGDDVWIGAQAILMQGVEVGTGAVIGAGAVVTRDVEPYEIVVGSPARVVRRRFGPDLCAALLASRWWELDLSVPPVRDFSDPVAFLAELERVAPPRFEPPTTRVSGAGP